MEDFYRLYKTVSINQMCDVFFIIGNYYISMETLHYKLDKVAAIPFFKKMFRFYPELTYIIENSYHVIVVDLNYQVFRMEFVNREENLFKYRAELRFSHFNFSTFLHSFKDVHNIVPPTFEYATEFQTYGFMNIEYIYIWDNTRMSELQYPYLTIYDSTKSRLGYFMNKYDAGGFKKINNEWVLLPLNYCECDANGYESESELEYGYMDPNYPVCNKHEFTPPCGYFKNVFYLCKI